MNSRKSTKKDRKLICHDGITYQVDKDNFLYRSIAEGKPPVIVGKLNTDTNTINIMLRMYKYHGVVYLVGMDKRVYIYNPDMPIQVGNWERESKTIIFFDGAIDAMKSGDIDTLMKLNEKKT